MSTTPNLLLSLIVANQNQKEVTANAALDGLDEALCSNTAVAMSDANYTFPTGQGSSALSNMTFIFTGALTADRLVILPPNAKPYIVSNQTTGGHNLIFETATSPIGAAATVINDGGFHLLYCDGSNHVYVVTAPAASFPQRTDDITYFLPGTYTNGEVVFSIPVAFAYTFPAQMIGSEGKVAVASTGTVFFSLRKNNVEFAQLTFHPSSVGGQFTMDASPAVPVTFAVGDVLSIVAPASADASLAGLGFQLLVTRAY
jgi:hypothetical protein